MNISETPSYIIYIPTLRTVPNASDKIILNPLTNTCIPNNNMKNNIPVDTLLSLGFNAIAHIITEIKDKVRCMYKNISA